MNNALLIDFLKLKTAHPIIETRLLLKKKKEKLTYSNSKRKPRKKENLISINKKKTQVTDNLATLAQEDKSSQVALQNKQISKPLSSNKTVQNEFLYK